MIVYNAHNDKLLDQKIKIAESIFKEIKVKHCFISGSFIYKENYKDIDVFIVSRTKKNIKLRNKKIKITPIDFNNTQSLFYHSITKSCIANSPLPKKELKVTISEYWNIINEAIPTILNEKNKYHKNIRFLVLYTEYFKTGTILDTYELNEKINSFKKYEEILQYVEQEVPKIMIDNVKPSYGRRFFYSWAGHYKNLRKYKAQNMLYEITHKISRGLAHC